MTDRDQIAALLKVLDIRVAEAQAVLAEASQPVRRLKNQIATLATPLRIDQPSPSQARNALAHDVWRSSQRQTLTQQLALARATEASAQDVLATLLARQEALKILLRDQDTAAQKARRQRETDRLLAQVLIRQTS